MVYAGSQSCSFAQATKDLQALAEVELTTKRVERWTKRVGDDRVEDVVAQAASYQALPLPQRRESPTTHVPQVACVMTDGGRIQERDRKATTKHEGSHWKESLVGCCLRMSSDEHTADPCPNIPETFIEPTRMSELSRGIKGYSGDVEGLEPSSLEPVSPRPGRPEVLVKSVVATRSGLEVFGQRLVAEAYRRGFHAAQRKAFVADGAATNWSVHRQHFSHYTPILDFAHAICYVYAAAMTGRSAAVGWKAYCQWAQWLWEGKVGKVIAAVAERAEELGEPPPDAAATLPSVIVDGTLRYLRNQQSRMKYDEYRKLGLPITSSHIESTIKQINRRMKGTEKFWADGAEPLLQLASDHLSETTAFDRYWQNYPANRSKNRQYQPAA